MRTAAGWLYALAVVSGLAAVVFGALLMGHTAQECVDTFDCTSVHPFTGAGAAVLVGGLTNAAVIAAVARLCEVVAGLRDHVGMGAATADEYEPPGAPTMYGSKD